MVRAIATIEREGTDVLGSWRTWVLTALFTGPILVYTGFGALWLWQKGWILPVSAAWLVSSVAFSVLASRWTKSQAKYLPPIDWDAPHTFSPFDRQAWEIVQEESERADQLSMETLTTADIYIDTGKRLVERLSRHYHPLSKDPNEKVAVVSFLSALELAAEDLNRLCRQVPGGDMITLGHYKMAVQAAGYIQKANTLYNFILPIINPLTGLPRLATQQLMVKPAWKNMQQNLLQWFYRAYVNRLGMHLVELYSGRLILGSDHYRKLMRKGVRVEASTDPAEVSIGIAVVGSRDVNLDGWAEELRALCHSDPNLLRARLADTNTGEMGVALLSRSTINATAGYTSHEGETARDRSTRKRVIDELSAGDLLILLVHPDPSLRASDLAFAREWSDWYHKHPHLELPPAIAVLTVPEGQDLAASRDQIDLLRSLLPPTVHPILALPEGPRHSQAIVAELLPALVETLARAERVALIRTLHEVSNESKVSRLFRQVRVQGRTLWRPRPQAPADSTK